MFTSISFSHINSHRHYNPLTQHTPQCRVFPYSFPTRRNEHKHISSESCTQDWSAQPQQYTLGSTLILGCVLFLFQKALHLQTQYQAWYTALCQSISIYLHPLFLFLFISCCIYQTFHKDWVFGSWDYWGFGSVSHFQRGQGVTLGALWWEGVLIPIP